MPASEPAGFTRVYADDFEDPYPVGAFAVGAAGASNDGRIVSSSPAYARYYDKINLYPDDQWDTGHYALYSPSRVVSTKAAPGANGVLDFWLHTEAGYARSAWVRPIVAGETQQDRGYGRLSMRVRVTGDPSGYGAVMLRIANATVDGEIDWFEGGLTQPIHGYFHPVGGGQSDITTPQPASLFDWHVFTIERIPGQVRCLLDDVVVRTITTGLSTANMKLVLQSGGDGQVPPVASDAHLQIDWITYADYTG